LIFRKWDQGAWSGLIWLRWALVNAVLNLRVPENAGNFSTKNLTWTIWEGSLVFGLMIREHGVDLSGSGGHL